MRSAPFGKIRRCVVEWKPSSQQPVTSEAPNGYDEIGESMARLVVEGLKTRSWVAEVVAVLGYNLKHVRAWVRHYEKIHAKEIESSNRKVRRKRAKIQRKLEKSDEIVSSQDMTA